MVRPLALSLWLASAIVLVGCNGQEQSSPAKLLTETEVVESTRRDGRPEGGAAVSRTGAAGETAAELVSRDQSVWRKHDSLPRCARQALAGYAEAELRMLVEVRARDKNTGQHMADDMKHALAFYESAVLPMPCGRCCRRKRRPSCKKAPAA